ncbi:MAG: hypothetical protein QM758_30015 [Armatimonas sp.]
MPLPLLDSDQFYWYGKVPLPAWSGFQNRTGPYESRTRAAPSTSEYHLMVEYPDGVKDTLPSEEQHRAYDYLLEHQEEIREMLLPRLFDEYERVAAEFTAEERQDYGIPEISAPNKLKTHMGLSNIHVSSISKDGIAYLGLSFGCDWEEEHGAGVMLHKSRVIDVGDASTSFEQWIAREDRDNGQKPRVSE